MAMKKLDSEDRGGKLARKFLLGICAVFATALLAVSFTSALRDGTSEAWNAFAANVVIVGMFVAVTFAMKWY